MHWGVDKLDVHSQAPRLGGQIPLKESRESVHINNASSTKVVTDEPDGLCLGVDLVGNRAHHLRKLQPSALRLPMCRNFYARGSKAISMLHD